MESGGGRCLLRLKEEKGDGRWHEVLALELGLEGREKVKMCSGEGREVEAVIWSEQLGPGKWQL